MENGSSSAVFVFTNFSNAYLLATLLMQRPFPQWTALDITIVAGMGSQGHGMIKPPMDLGQCPPRSDPVTAAEVLEEGSTSVKLESSIVASGDFCNIV